MATTFCEHVNKTAYMCNDCGEDVAMVRPFLQGESVRVARELSALPPAARLQQLEQLAVSSPGLYALVLLQLKE